jgi:phosphoribosylglycinamide formyltransferase-1
MGKKIRIGALISGGGTNLQAIIDSCESGKIDGEMVFVGSDNPEAGGLERARKHTIPTFVVDYAAVIREFKANPENVLLPGDFNLQDALSKQSLFPADHDLKKVGAFLKTRAMAEAELLAKIKRYPFDLIVLAGFMRTLTPYFIDRINDDPANPRIMNIHPALLPAFPGVDGYGDTFRYGCKVGGCTVHFIDYGEDSGPIIGQKAFQIFEDDTIDSIKEKGLKLEWRLYPECIQLFAERRLKIVRKSYELDSGKKMKRTVVKILPKSG